MKKIYQAFLFLFVTAAANAQLTQGTHAPAAGEKYEMYHCDSVSTSPGAAGANQTWNFSTVTTFSNLLESFTVSTASSPSYPGANVGVASSPNRTSYFNSSANNLMYFGGNITVGPVIGTLNYSQPAVAAAYPMSMSTSSTAATLGSIVVTSPINASGTFTGTSSVTVDGTGTLTVGGDTYTNVVRVLTSQAFNFTTNVANGSITQANYEWFASGVKAPVFAINSSTATTPLGSNTKTVVTRLKPVIDTSGLPWYAQDQTQVSVYPNPSAQQVNVSCGSTQAVEIRIFDINGKHLNSSSIAGGEASLDVSAYNNGVYLYVVLNKESKVLGAGRFSVAH